MARDDRPAQYRQRRQVGLFPHEDFPSVCSGLISVRSCIVPSTAQSWATMARFTPSLLALPIEILDRIAYHAIPPNASMLNPATLRPKASTLTLQLVCRTFRTSVLEQYFRRRPLQLHLFNAVLHEVLTREPNDNGGILPSLKNIDHALCHHEDRQRWRLQKSRQIPSHRFRRIEIHLVPQLAKINLTDDKLAAFFYEVPNVDDDESLEYEDLLHDMKHCLLQDAKHLAEHMYDHFKRFGHGQGQPQIEVFCFESTDELPEYDVRQYQLDSLPGAWGVHLP